jgi:hypothetical protein
MKSLNTLTVYTFGVLIVWVAIFTISFCYLARAVRRLNEHCSRFARSNF